MATNRSRKSGGSGGPIAFTVIGIAASVGMLFLATGGSSLSEVSAAAKVKAEDTANALSPNRPRADTLVAAPVAPIPLPVIRAAGARTVSPRAFTPLFAADVVITGGSTSVEPPPPSNGGGDKPPVVEVEKVETLLPPSQITAQASPDSMAIFVFWADAQPTEAQKLPADQGYLVYRSEAAREPKTWKLLTTSPVVGHAFADVTANADTEYVYTVAPAVLEREGSQPAGATQGERATVTVDGKTTTVRYARGAGTASAEAATLPNPTTVSWAYLSHSRAPSSAGGGEIMKARLIRWHGTRTALAGDETKWFRLVLEIDGIGLNRPIGGEYEFYAMQAGELPGGLKCALTVQTFNGDTLVDYTDPRQAARDVRASVPIDFNTGATYRGHQQVADSNKEAALPTAPKAPRNPHAPAEPEPAMPEDPEGEQPGEVPGEEPKDE